MMDRKRNIDEEPKRKIKKVLYGNGTENIKQFFETRYIYNLVKFFFCFVFIFGGAFDSKPSNLCPFLFVAHENIIQHISLQIFSLYL